MAELLLPQALQEVYKPSPWQAKFHSICNNDGTVIDEILGAGSAGPGKSLALTMNPFDKIAEETRRCMDPDHPFPLSPGGSRGWALHLRRIGNSLGQTIDRAKRLFPQIDPKVKWYEADRRFVFSCGYHYEFGHCQDRDDWHRYDSNEYDELLFDELVEFYAEQYFNIKSRLRSSDPILRRKLRVRSMSNPNRSIQDGAIVTDNPYWVRDRFVKPHIPGNQILMVKEKSRTGKLIKKTRLYLPARLTDNPDPEFIETYERQLIDLPDHIKRAMMDGDWFVVAGAFWSDVWHTNIHVCKRFKPPMDWKFFRSMDWGFRKPGCIGWYALNHDGVLFKIRELTFVKMTAKAVAHRVREIEIDMGLWDRKNGMSLITGPADTQLWEERGDDIAVTKASMMANEGVHWVPADKRSRARNSRLLYERLADHDGFTKEPGIIFFDTCHNTIQRIPSVPTDPKDHEQPLDTGDDHWVDDTLYACAYASSEANVQALDMARVDDDFDDFEEHPAHDGSWVGDYSYGMRK